MTGPGAETRRTAGLPVEVIGSGVAGLCAAAAFAERGCAVTVVAASDGADASCCSWWAGGMLAPDCEGESAEPLIAALGAESMAWWAERVAVTAQGSLVVAMPRDTADLRRFARMTSNHRAIAAEEIAQLEPDLSGRFAQALFFEGEAHLDPRAALAALRRRLEEQGVHFVRRHLDPAALQAQPARGWRVDCRGLAARDVLTDLRGVRGEMAVIRAPGLHLSRPVRLLHPRIPLYVVPRADHVFMVGATAIESEARGPATLRSVLELLSAAHALNPAFGEAEVLELGADVRPAFADNLPRLRVRGRVLYINGLYRHGFLCAPAMARRAAAQALDGQIFPEVMDEDHGERRTA
jgi:glycine oxidase